MGAPWVCILPFPTNQKLVPQSLTPNHFTCGGKCCFFLAVNRLNAVEVSETSSVKFRFCFWLNFRQIVFMCFYRDSARLAHGGVYTKVLSNCWCLQRREKFRYVCCWMSCDFDSANAAIAVSSWRLSVKIKIEWGFLRDLAPSTLPDSNLSAVCLQNDRQN